MEIITHSAKQTELAGARLAKKLDKNAFIALYGDLGAGKTAFVRGLASVLTPTASVHSPTYTIVNTYKDVENTFYHFDMYRIKDEDDLYSCGFYDYEDGFIAAEWCENIPFALPPRYTRVEINKSGGDENARIITVTEVGT